MTSDLDRHVSQIEGLRDIHLSLLKKILLADGGKMFELDILASAVVKRSMSLCAGFSALVRSHNYTCAASLLRLQLDSCLRFFAAYIVEQPHEFASSVLKGVPVRKLKDRNGIPMTDRHLVDSLGAQYEWMPRVYEATSGFIHLSERHVFSVCQPGKTENSISIRVSETDEEFPEELWIEMAIGFLACTNALFDYLKGWAFTKENPDIVRRLTEERGR